MKFENDDVSFFTTVARLAGFAGAVFGWSPDTFWGATPAELGALVRAATGEDDDAPPEAATIVRMREEFPDG